MKKLQTLTAACALAFAGQAFALSPSTTPDVTLFISGSSALQLVIGQLANGMMQPGTLDVYYDSASNGSNSRAYFGTMKTDSSIPAALQGKKVLLINRAQGGSIYGVNPVAQATPLSRLDVTTTSCGTAASGTDATTGAPLWKCSGTVSTVPDGGVSDVEPAMFQGVNLPSGWTAAGASLANLTVGSTLAAPFAVILTNNLKPYVTNLSKMQAASLLAAQINGTYQDWGAINASLAGNPVMICRRSPGSGTQASTNNYLLGFPCSKTPLSPASYTNTYTGSSTPSGFTVIENDSSGKLGKCMDYLQNGTPAGQAIDVTNGSLVPAGSPNSIILNPPTGGYYGIGIMGLDYPPTKAGDLYFYPTLDGISITKNNDGQTPDLTNPANGIYGWVSENGYQYRNTTVNGIAPPAGAQLALLQLIQVRAGDPAVFGSTTLPVPGVMGLIENGYTPTGTDANAYPVWKGANFSNSCQAPQLYF